MNDYKELIKCLKIRSENNRDGGFWNEGVSDSIDAAIKAIEQLVREQQETTYLLKQYIPFTDNPCGFCAHKNAKHDTKEFIENCDVCLEAQHYCCWEYGGLSDAMKASMELNEIIKSKLRE